MKHRLAAAGLATALTLPLAGLAAAPANAAVTVNYEIGCHAANIRTGPATSYTAVGVGYHGDRDLISKATMHGGKYTWFYGTVTRRSDDRRVTGWVTAQCIGY